MRKTSDLIVQLKESVRVAHGDQDLILEAGEKIRIIQEAVDPELQKVAGIVDKMSGLFGLQKPLEAAYGKGNVSFWGYAALVVKLRNGKKILIASPQNLGDTTGAIPVQGGNLFVGYGS